MKQIPECFATTPIVYAVGKNYQIIVPVTSQTLMWVEIAGNSFYDDVNGILRSNCTTHRMTVPQQLLDNAGSYKICYRMVNERKPYFSDVSEMFEYSSQFYGVSAKNARFFHIADAHNNVEKPVAAAKAYGEIDFLILNGDLPDHSGDINNFTTIHKIAAEITNGEKPVVFSRGNHDMRGIYAENIAEHTPTDNGKSYYTFRLGSIWGMILDCGEDKFDEDSSYGHTICCKDFKRRQTEFIKEVIHNSENEYNAEDVKSRLLVCHVPFTERFRSPFNIDEDTYSEWCHLLREYIKPELMLCGHIHEAYVTNIGDELDCLGQPCPVVVGSQMTKNKYDPNDDKPHIMAGIEIGEDNFTVVFQGSDGNVYSSLNLRKE